jgi:hypothetical protein
MTSLVWLSMDEKLLSDGSQQLEDHTLLLPKMTSLVWLSMDKKLLSEDSKLLEDHALLLPEMTCLVGLSMNEKLLSDGSQLLEDLALLGVQVLVVQQVGNYKTLTNAKVFILFILNVGDF